MIGVVLPAHDEEEMLDACLDSIRTAAAHRRLAGESVRIVVVLDACTDRSLTVARRHPVEVLSIRARSVGAARSCGAERMLAQGARWLAFTDADTLVSPRWLVEQLALGADAVCGTVDVHDWTLHPDHVRRRYGKRYRDEDGHAHVHGANLGVAAAAYRAVGGFPPFAVHEDVALVAALMAGGYRVSWSARPRVSTSARLRNRVSGGFAGYLSRLALEVD